MRTILPPKLAGETVSVVFDFSAQAQGATLTAVSVVATTYSGTDASPSSILSGSPAISGGKLTQLVTGGVAGVIYKLVATVSLVDGQVLPQSAYLAISPDLP